MAGSRHQSADVRKQQILSASERVLVRGGMDKFTMDQVAIEAGKTSGLWHFMDDVDALFIPKDLETQLKAKTEAYEFFVNINPSSKRFVLRSLKLSKTETTRLKRIHQLVELSAKGEKLKGS